MTFGRTLFLARDGGSMSVLENKDYTLCVPDKWGMRFLKPSKGMELKQHQEM